MVAFQCLLFRANIVVWRPSRCCAFAGSLGVLKKLLGAGALLLPSVELTWGRSGALLHNKNQAVQEAGVGGPRKGGGQGAGRSCRRAQVQLAGAEKVKFRTDGCKRSRASAPIVPVFLEVMLLLRFMEWSCIWGEQSTDLLFMVPVLMLGSSASLV